ncbi:MAG: hypothetical protein AAGN35_10785 [Bacteroidota bacterium]
MEEQRLRYERAYQKGKKEMRNLGIFLVILNFSILIAELIFWRSYSTLIIEIVVALASTALVVAGIVGRSVRWSMFIALFLASMYAFYLAGVRMAAAAQPEFNLKLVFSVGTALALLVSCLYLGYSPEIGIYLRKIRKIDPSE